MILGANFADPRRFDDLRRLYTGGHIRFLEVLVDNFLHLDPEIVAADLDGIPVALHVMFSRYLESQEDFLVDYAIRIRALSATLKPIYISDHLGRFSVEERMIPRVVELDYRRDLDRACLRLDRWQRLLGCRVFVENFPSASPEGAGQPAFFAALTARTGAGLLFDASNAVVAQLNGADAAADWIHFGETVVHAHAAGYRLADNASGDPVTIDSHDAPLSPETLSLLTRLRGRMAPEATLSIERDSNFEFNSVADDIARADAALHLPQ